MRVPSWLPTSALVGMLIYVLVYLGFFLMYIITGNSVGLWGALLSTTAYFVFTGLHIRYIRRRKSRERS